MAKITGVTKILSVRTKLNSRLQKKLEEKFYMLQKYGAKKASKLKITEKDIERLVFEDR